MSPDQLTIAVTGVGAIIGQGIMRSLRASKKNLFIIGIDRNAESPGTYLCDRFEQRPKLAEDSPEYLDWWRHLVTQHRVALVLPGLELDVQFLSQHREQLEHAGVTLGLNTSELIELSSDKWRFGERLATIPYPVIPSLRPSTWAEAIAGLGAPPLLLKPLNGNGSRGIQILEDEQDFIYWGAKLTAPWMLQRLVGTPDQEFTVGVFGLGNGRYIGPIMFRRRLSAAGNTQQAEVVERLELLESAVETLCSHFTPIGPTNFQFRIDGQTPYLLEINPRFSSSNSIRTAFGFNEAEMAIDFCLYGQTPAIPNLRKGIAWRYSEDFVRYACDSV
jgi:carbamoyl-phosphate synthase large subunit